MEILDFTKEWIAEAEELLVENYKEEKACVPCLPQITEWPELGLFAQNGLGVAAVEDGKLLGFLGGYEPFRPVYCTPDTAGVWSPLHAHGARKENRVAIYRRLYQAAGAKWAAAGAASHAVTLFAHDEHAREAFFMYGFGARCTDLMRNAELRPMPETAKGIRFTELPGERSGELRSLRKALTEHLSQSPCFMKQHQEDVEKWLDWREKDAPRMFAALKEERPVAYLEVVPQGKNGENFISWQKEMWNICGAYCLPEERGAGTAAGVLWFLASTLAKEGATHLGVDCETINPTALGFWKKHFMPYTFSVVRRIDENALLL
ncbi:MAG: GNAT family N-acetyltransferase [Clostridiales bacterium]|nr:GNAT family N-acetyltransferase [Clostridiales bacterium]